MSETVEPDSPEATKGRLATVRKVGGIALLGLALTAFFVYLGFPYERLAENIAAQLATRSDTTLRFSDAGPGLTWLGPGFELEDVALVPDGGKAIRLGEVLARPAWSLSWFRGVPAIAIRASSDTTSAAFTVWVDDPVRVEGAVTEFDLGQVTQAGSLDRADLTGRIDLEFDISASTSNMWEGSARIRGRDGSFTPPDLGVPIPYDRFDAEVTLPGDVFIRVDSAELDGEALKASGQGLIGWTPQQGSGPLDLEFDLDVLDPGLIAKLRVVKIGVDKEGQGKLQIGGTLAKPLFR